MIQLHKGINNGKFTQMVKKMMKGSYSVTQAGNSKPYKSRRPHNLDPLTFHVH